MSVSVRPPDAADWLDAVSVSAAEPPYTLTAAADRLALPVDYLTPGRPYTLRMLAEATSAGGSVSAVLDGAPLSVPPAGAPAWLEWTTDAARPVRLDVVRVATLTVHAMTLEAPGDPLPARPVPGAVLSLELSTPRAGAAAFLLDVGRLDRDALTAGTPWPGTLVLGTGKLGQTYLHAPDLIEWWAPVLTGARSLTVHRGSRTDGLVPVADVGTLVAQWPDAADPRSLGIRRGTPVRAYHWPDRRPIFTGAVSRAVVAPNRPGVAPAYVVTLEAVDAVAELAGTMRYGAIVGPGLTETWADRIARLMGSAPGLAWRIAPADVDHAPSMANTVHESSLASHLDVVAASARGAWWVDAAGTVTLCPGVPAGGTVAVLTDTPDPDPAAWPYLDAHAGWDSADVVSVVTLTNLAAAWDGAGWAAADVETVVTHSTLAATYGARSGTGTVNVPPEQVDTIAAALARGLSSAAAVRSVVLDGRARHARAAALELLEPVTARLRGEATATLIGALTHDVTPDRWHVTLTLTRRPTP